MGSMVHYFLMISDSMGKHGEHGNSLFSSLQIAWKSKGSKVLHFLWFQTAWESMGSMGTPFFMGSNRIIRIVKA